jgi:hypothetical protein
MDSTTARVMTSDGLHEKSSPAAPLARTAIARGEEVERLRRDKGYSVERLAAKAGVHTRTAKRMICGHRVLLDSIRAVAGALGTTCEALLRAKDPSEHMTRVEPQTNFELQITVHGSVATAWSPQRLAELGATLAKSLADQDVCVDAHFTRLNLESDGVPKKVIEKSDSQAQRSADALWGAITSNGYG